MPQLQDVERVAMLGSNKGSMWAPSCVCVHAFVYACMRLCVCACVLGSPITKMLVWEGGSGEFMGQVGFMFQSLLA